jgi:hypothetical protein
VTDLLHLHREGFELRFTVDGEPIYIAIDPDINICPVHHDHWSQCPPDCEC